MHAVVVVLTLALGIGLNTGTLDPLVYLGVSVILVGSAAAAMLGPAWRATTTDPVAALRT